MAEPLALTPPTGEVPVPAAPPGLLTPEQTYSWWLSRMLAGEAEVIETWPRIFLAARTIGLTRLGSRHYTPKKFREACERLVREGRAVRFWLVQRGRPRRAATTMAHLWAWGLAGFHRRLGRRGSTR